MALIPAPHKKAPLKEGLQKPTKFETDKVKETVLGLPIEA